MKSVCPYCNYQKPNRSLDETILHKLTESDLPREDYLLWLQRIIEKFGLVDWLKDCNGIKIHIGLKHKGCANYIRFLLTDKEEAILNKTEMRWL